MFNNLLDNETVVKIWQYIYQSRKSHAAWLKGFSVTPASSQLRLDPVSQQPSQHWLFAPEIHVCPSVTALKVYSVIAVLPAHSVLTSRFILFAYSVGGFLDKVSQNVLPNVGMSNSHPVGRLSHATPEGDVTHWSYLPPSACASSSVGYVTLKKLWFLVTSL